MTRTKFTIESSDNIVFTIKEFFISHPENEEIKVNSWTGTLLQCLSLIETTYITNRIEHTYLNSTISNLNKALKVL